MGKLLFLGTGTSTGVPEIGCQCRVCRSQDKRDQRLRASALLSVGGSRILLDCGPDFRAQVLDLPFEPLDAVLLTHEHYDHVGGLDDLRLFGRLADVNIYAEKHLCDTIYKRMPYCFGENKYPGSPNIIVNELHVHESVDIAGQNVLPLRVMHGKMEITGYRVGDMAYLTDVSNLPDEEYLYLKGLKLLVVSALRQKPHPSHQCLAEAVAMASKISAERTYFTHMSHDVGLHEEVESTLPSTMHLAYDGLELEW